MSLETATIYKHYIVSPLPRLSKFAEGICLFNITGSAYWELIFYEPPFCISQQPTVMENRQKSVLSDISFIYLPKTIPSVAPACVCVYVCVCVYRVQGGGNRGIHFLINKI